MRDVRHWLYTASRKIPMDFTRASRAAVNRTPRSLQNAQRETLTVLFCHCAPGPTMIRATCDAHLRRIGLVVQRIADRRNYCDHALLPANRYIAWLFHTAPNYPMRSVAPSAHRGVRRSSLGIRVANRLRALDRPHYKCAQEVHPTTRVRRSQNASQSRAHRPGVTLAFSLFLL